MALTLSTWALDRRPCLVCAAMERALPSAVRGPVDLPPCSLQRLRSLMAGFWHAPPALALFRGPRTLSPGPSLKGGQARFTDRFPVSYLVLFQ
jgi:hypothetical protein